MKMEPTTHVLHFCICFGGIFYLYTSDLYPNYPPPIGHRSPSSSRASPHSNNKTLQLLGSEITKNHVYTTYMENNFKGPHKSKRTDVDAVHEKVATEVNKNCKNL